MNAHQYNTDHGKRHQAKSLADYTVDALIPVCTAGLVMSFVFFLLDLRAVYYGGFDLPKLRWVYFWFVMAAVCVNRISVRYGADLHALPYALGLGGAMICFLVVKDVGGSLPINIAMMGLVWWASHRLTKECTLSDDDADSSGQGLLASVVSESKSRKEADLHASSEPPPPGPLTGATETKRTLDPESDWLARQILSLFARGRGHSTEHDSRAKKCPTQSERGSGRHPGISVIYFSIVALIAFGLGEKKLAALRPLHSHAFICMVFYVLFALALLTLTSFSGLRRYLRQRGIMMSKEIAPLWLTLGAAIILFVIGVSYVLPRSSPSRQKGFIERWTQQIAGKGRLETFKSKTPNSTISGADGKRAGNGKAAEGISQPDSPKAGRAKSQFIDDALPERARASRGGKQSQGAKGEGGSGRQPGGRDVSAPQGKNARHISAGGPSARPAVESRVTNGTPRTGEKQRSTAPSLAPDNDDLQKEWLAQRERMLNTAKTVEKTGRGILGAISWLMVVLPKIILSLAILYVAWRFLKALLILLQGRVNWSAAFLLAIERLRSRFSEFLLRRRRPFRPRKGQGPDDSRPSTMRRRRIYENPFVSGKLRGQLAPADLVTYTYEALMAHAEAIGCPRQPHQTPYEYAQNLPEQLRPLKSPIAQLTRLYVRAVYTPYEISQKDIGALKVFWEGFENRRNNPANGRPAPVPPEL